MTRGRKKYDTSYAYASWQRDVACFPTQMSQQKENAEFLPLNIGEYVVLRVFFCQDSVLVVNTLSCYSPHYMGFLERGAKGGGGGGGRWPSPPADLCFVAFFCPRSERRTLQARPPSSRSWLLGPGAGKAARLFAWPSGHCRWRLASKSLGNLASRPAEKESI